MERGDLVQCMRAVDPFLVTTSVQLLRMQEDMTCSSRVLAQVDFQSPYLQSRLHDL